MNDCDWDCDSVLISLEELALFATNTNRENEDSVLRQLFSEADTHSQDALIAPSVYYGDVLRTLRCSESVQVKSRKFLCALDDLSNPGNPTLHELRKPPSAAPHIPKEERMEAYDLLHRWKHVLLEEAEREINPILLRNNSPTTLFRQFLDENGLQYFSLNAPKPLLTGALSTDEVNDRFLAYCSDWEDYGNHWTYRQEVMTDETAIFGDPLSSTDVHSGVPLLPFALQPSLGDMGRGTLGAVVRIMIEGHQLDYILTCAHVACSKLTPSTDSSVIDMLNDSSLTMGYSRGQHYLDYALLPVVSMFRHESLPFRLTERRFVDANELFSIWADVPELGSEVYKRGATTNETVGTIESYNTEEGTFTIRASQVPFSAGGDSGALVFVNDNEHGLVPIGLHCAGCDGVYGRVLSLKAIFDNFCHRNNLTKIKVKFLSPELPNALTFIPNS